MTKRNIIVIGTSAGGIEALIELCRGLPADLPATIFVVCHISAHSSGGLAKILSRKGILPAHNAVDREPILPGQIYVAPPDHHLLIERDFVRVTQGPKENRFRPAIDPLFRSAAYAYGSQVIGVILTGGLDDGTAGLWAIKERGGLTLVQDPDEAVFSSMPLSAINNVEIDYQIPLAEMPPLLTRLVSEPVEEGGAVSDRLEIEVKIAEEEKSTNRLVEQLGEVSMFTCPECHGSLWEMHEGGILRFRCRTGHAYTAQALLADLSESIESMLWSAIRGIEESVSLMNHMAKHLQQHGQNELAESFLAQAQTTVHRADLVRQAAMGQENPKAGVEAEAQT